MAEYRDLLGVGNVMAVDRAGTVVARAQDTRADFSYERYNQLRTVFDTGEPSEAVEVEFDDGATRLRYYAARIDDEPHGGGRAGSRRAVPARGGDGLA